MYLTPFYHHLLMQKKYEFCDISLELEFSITDWLTIRILYLNLHLFSGSGSRKIANRYREMVLHNHKYV